MINNVSVPETFDLPNRPSLAEKKQMRPYLMKL